MRGLTPQLFQVLSNVADQRGDGELLDAFLTRHADEDFARLVRKYGPMVWGVCRRALPNPTDAEDAFQTVFLVLIQRGRKLTGQETIGPWLHRVAVWTTRNARRRIVRRQGQPAAMLETIPAASADRDLALDLDAALLSLPDKVRASIILCHLLGFSRADAAARLGCAERTLSSWLALGLEKLRRKLRGLDPARALGAATAAAPAALADTVVRAAISLRTTAVAASVVSSTVSQLAEGVIRMFWLKKATAACMALATVFAFGVGVGVSTYQLGSAVGGDEPGKEHRAAGKGTSSAESETDASLQAKIRDAKAELDRIVYQMNIYSIVEQNLDGTSATDKLLVEAIQAKLKKLEQDRAEAVSKLERFTRTLDELVELSVARAQLPQAQKDASPDRGKAQPEKPGAKPPKPQPLTGPEELDAKLRDLEMQLRRLQVEAERARAEAREAQAQTELKERQVQQKMEAIRAAMMMMQKEKEKQKAPGGNEPAAVKPTGAYLQLTLGAKDAAWPYQVKEYNANGKSVGAVAFENAEVLGRYLTRTMKDASAPKELRVAYREGVKKDEMAAVLETAKASGYKVARLDLANELNDPRDDLRMRLKAEEAALAAALAAELEARKQAKQAMEERNRELERARELERFLREKPLQKDVPPVPDDVTKRLAEDLQRKLDELNKKLGKPTNPKPPSPEKE
jgi:RNA polymerase sigma factor (sigma-70 family)